MDPSRCPECGGALTARQAADGTCPACLLQLGLAAADGAPPDASSLVDAGADPGSIGPYRIVRRLGEGGMGIVYLAEQDAPVRRRVALKVVRRGIGTREVIRRFDAERQTLALMDHPSIARVYDAGETADGLPYFAMEYVEGEPITEHCDRERLAMRERLELLTEVCTAVQHAHRKGVIHRDIKPSNVLVTRVDDRAVPKVIDFGVAKAIDHRVTERSLFTEMGTIVGTPEYMSPEQAEFTGERVDTRTDVYSLGVLQYELMTGALPFDPVRLRAGGFDEICRRIREEEPSRPSARVSGAGDTAARWAHLRRVDATALRRQLAGELDWITMKALEKDPARRYGSPQELADDLHRFLRHEPVLAGPPSAAYRLHKFVRRNRLMVAAAAAVSATLVVGAIAATTFALREAAERRRAEQARAELEKVVAFQARMISGVDPAEMGARLLADLRRRAREASQAIGAVTGDAGAIEAPVDQALSRVNGTDAALRVLDEEILERAARAIESEFTNEPLIEARLWSSLAESYSRIGLLARAEPLLERVLELRKGALGDDHSDTLESQVSLAMNQVNMSRFKEAETALRETAERSAGAVGPDHPVTLSARHGLGIVYRRQGRYKEAEALLLETLEARRRVLGSEAHQTADTIEELVWVYDYTGRTALAEPLQVEAVAIRKRVDGADHPATLTSLGLLATMLTNLGRHAEAEALHREVLERTRRVRGSENHAVCAALNNLGRLYFMQSRIDDAAAAQREALAICERTIGADHFETIAIALNLASALMNAGRFEEAEAQFGSGIERLDRSVGPDHHFSLVARNNLAILYHKTGRHNEASKIFRATAEHPRATPDVKIQAAGFLMEPTPSRDTAAAIRYASQAVEMTGRRNLAALSQLTVAYSRHGDTDRAEALWKELVAMPGAGATQFNNYAWFLLTSAAQSQARAAAALEFALKANELSGHKDPDRLDTLALAYHRTGQNDKAMETVERALALIAPDNASRREPFVKRLEEYRTVLHGSAK